MNPPIASSVFAILSALVEEKMGLHHAFEDRELFADKVWGRAREAGFESLLDYYYFLRYDDAAGEELEKLTDALVVGETYFFREADQLETMVRACIMPLVAEGRRPRIWCAACATGEEPMSVVMLLDHYGLKEQVDVVASDISEKHLFRARAGRYPLRSLQRAANKPLVERFATVEPGGVTFGAEVRDRLQFHRVNLVEENACVALGTFDVVLCRNVLIYFRE